MNRFAAVAASSLVPLGTPLAADAPSALPAATSAAWIITAGLGWALAILLVVYLILLQKRWRTTFETKEWLLLPSKMADDLAYGIGDIQVVMSKTAEQLLRHAHQATQTSSAAATETRAAREEFQILREELDARQKEIKLLQLGQEFHYRRPVLMRVVRALEIISDDQLHTRDPAKTLEGVQIELHECLEDNHVTEWAPPVGVPIADAVGFDTRTAQRRETDDLEKKGMVAEVERPAYVVRGPGGHQEVLVPARITVFV